MAMGGWVMLLALAMVLAACTGAHSAADAASGQPPPPEQSAREALAALETTPEQDDLLLALVGKFAIVLSKSGKARRAFTDELLKALMRGKVNTKVMDPLRSDFEKAIRDATPEVLALLNELHGILTPKQRAKLIDDIDARFEGAAAQRKARNKEMIDELDIGFVQKIEIAQAMSDKMDHLRPVFEKMKRDGKAAGEAFKRNDFDATELDLVKTDLGKLYLETAVVLVATLAPELEYEQRRTLSNIIKHRLAGGDTRR
jgi:Spy/CpxP family protein refolding chaperone